jgi:hypothetical protein
VIWVLVEIAGRVLFVLGALWLAYLTVAVIATSNRDQP